MVGEVKDGDGGGVFLSDVHKANEFEYSAQV